MKPLPQKGLVITRKRKKWKFAHFDAWENCFSFQRNGDPSFVKKQLTTCFQGRTLESRPLILELAAGNAQFSLELARRHQENNYIAIDVKSDRLYTSAKKALKEGVGNIAFLRMDIKDLDEVFSKNSVETIWLTFPDPYPKDRWAKHRLSHVSFLQQYRNILSDTGMLKFKTDSRDLFLWSLEQFVTEKWQFQELSFDLHESDLPEDYKVKTYYEERFTSQGIPTNFCSLRL